MTNKETDLYTTADVTQEPMVNPNFQWDFGYRLGFGYIFNKRTWDVAVNWTLILMLLYQKRSNNGDLGFGMFPVWSLADDILPVDWVAKSKMDWKLHLNLLDIDFGRAFVLRKVFFLRPFAGLRLAWINQDVDITYKGGIFAKWARFARVG